MQDRYEDHPLGGGDYVLQVKGMRAWSVGSNASMQTRLCKACYRILGIRMSSRLPIALGNNACRCHGLLARGCGDRSPAGKELTPAITVPQIREGINSILHRAYGYVIASNILHDRVQWRIRNEVARLYDWITA